MEPSKASEGPVADDLRKLEEVVADLRAQTGVEAFELRARIRELERRLDELTQSAADRASGAEPSAAAQGQARKKDRGVKPSKAARAAARQVGLSSDAGAANAETNDPQPGPGP